ncbi:SRPBCC domain-containing protein [Pseudoroseicyclus sp. CXY001]|uniref:SRPBCC domain-containing protein n=1 Tax=Pseudoroseicyclus sp. CXY001 TaxID=3242492 RepID=UPI00358DAE5E
MDFARQLGDVERSVNTLEIDGKAAGAVVLSRRFGTSAGDLWEVLTDPERIPRWFAPVSGELKEGGRFQVEGNAGGQILTCTPPRKLELTWEMQGDVSWVTLELEEVSSEETAFTLVHTAHVSPFWDQFGPGAVGVGWDGALLGLALHVAEPEAEKPDAMTFHETPEGRAFLEGAAARWGTADEAAGASPEDANRRAAATRAFYLGETPPGA